MKIVIDKDALIILFTLTLYAICGDDYNDVKTAVTELVERINYTPLPIEHGRLIDADRLIPTCKFHGDCQDEKCEICSDNAVSFSDIETAPTVIEADKGEEE